MIVGDIVRVDSHPFLEWCDLPICEVIKDAFGNIKAYGVESQGETHLVEPKQISLALDLSEDSRDIILANFYRRGEVNVLSEQLGDTLRFLGVKTEFLFFTTQNLGGGIWQVASPELVDEIKSKHG